MTCGCASWRRKPQFQYIRAVRRLAAFLGRSPDTVTVEDLRRYQLHLVDHGTSPVSINAAITGLKFFFEVTLDRSELMAKMRPVRVPRKLPVVLSREEVRSRTSSAPTGRLGGKRNKVTWSLGQLKVMSAIEQYRSAALGGHVLRCGACEQVQIAYNSCRNRHCPKCQARAARRWLEARQADLLPVPCAQWRPVHRATHP
jgi:Transposase zinc-binding domain/Phage integrase, N-terminal SAM-like domain